MTASKSRRPKQASNLNKNRTFRARGALDEKLEAAAKLSGRSVNEEIEYRLERSFRDEEIRERAFEQAWAAFEKKKALENVEAALDNVEAALARAKALGSDAAHRENDEPKNPAPPSDALKDIVQHAPKKGEKL
ncbi:MAG: hypothetical protein K2Y71_07120 [Xanthobacteraceae bacterium]|nr:hypothetical protein [Xanthobacteraceae bacterium]